MQFQGYLSWSLVYFLLSLSFIILILVIRGMAIKRYHLERRGYAEKSFLGTLGDNLSNTPSVLFNAVLFATAFLMVNFFLEFLRRQIFYEEVEVPVIMSIVGIALIILLYFRMSTRGRVYRQVESIEREYQTLGYEELVIQKQLADLVHDIESEDYTRAEISRQVIDNLSKKENKTGDAVRRMMTNPEKLRDMQGTKPVPSQWRYLRVTYIVAITFAATLVVGTWGRLFDYFSLYDIIMKILPLAFILLIAFTLCFYIESTSATEKRRKARYGI
ncbi:hypothetical protein EU527_18090 [Candidatus Thorarchaeota archaeon]|nr:MAG: hypothetical protein EU527_18090 [Candidatus Thorarchaeota archaeon]